MNKHCSRHELGTYNSTHSDRWRVQSCKTAFPLQVEARLSPVFLADCTEGRESQDPIFRFDLLEWLMELRETFYLLDHWIIIKGYNSEIARQKRCIGHSVEKSLKISCPLWESHVPQLPHIHQPGRFPKPLHSLGFYGGFITQMTVDWVNLQLLSPPSRRSGRFNSKFQPANHGWFH